MSLSNSTLYVDLYTTYNSFATPTYLSLPSFMAKLADLAGLTDAQKEIIHQITDFSQAHNFTITNLDVYKLTDPKVALERLATRIFVKIHDDLIAPATDSITNFLNTMWDIHQTTNTNKDFVALENLEESQEKKIEMGLQAIKPLIDQECHSWNTFFNFANRHFIESYLNIIKHLILTFSLTSASTSSPESTEASTFLINQFQQIETNVRTYFPKFEEICPKILKKSNFEMENDLELGFYFDFCKVRANLLNGLLYVQNELIPAAFEGISQALEITKDDSSFLEL